MRGSFAVTLVALLVTCGSLASAADPQVPMTVDGSLFNKPPRIKFVQRSAHVREWQVQYRRGDNGHSFYAVVQTANSSDAEFDAPADAQLLFPILFKEALTTDADQAQASLGDSGQGKLWGGTVSYAPARELEENMPVFEDFIPDANGNVSNRATRGPNWNECVMFIWRDTDPVVQIIGRYCHRSRAGSPLMSTEGSLAMLKELNLQLEE
jgi:hypothetical protein